MNPIYKDVDLRCRLPRLIFCLGLVLICACSPHSETRPDPPVATVGERIIDWDYLWSSYHLDPKWGRGASRQEGFQNQLDFLIEQKLFAQEACRMGLQSDPGIQGYLAFLKEKEMIKELYGQVVESQISISDAEYQHAYTMSKEKRRFVYVETPDSLRAQEYARRLAGVDPTGIELLDPQDDTKRISPPLSFGDMAESIESVAFSLSAEEVSTPLESDGRYVVLRLLDGERDLFMSETDFAESKPHLRKIIAGRRATAIAGRYVAELMSDKQVRINPRPFQILAGHFNQLVRDKAGDAPLPSGVSNVEMRTVQASVEAIREQPLVTFKGGVFTVEEFLMKLLNMPAGLRPKVNMSQPLRQAIGTIVRNHFLAIDASSRHLDEVLSVRKAIEQQADVALSRQYMKLIRDSISVSEDDILSFLGKPRFQQVNKQLDGKLDRDTVEDLLADAQFAEARRQWAARLKDRYPVTIAYEQLAERILHPQEIADEMPARLFYREDYR